MYKYTDHTASDKSESNNFKIAKEILTGIMPSKSIKSIDKTSSSTAHVDLEINFNEGCKYKKYKIELKPNNGKALKSGFPLLFEKYIGMVSEQSEDEKVFVMYLMKDSYYIFSIDKLKEKKLSELNISNWLIRRTQLSNTDNTMQYFPTIWMPISDCTYSGYTSN